MTKLTGNRVPRNSCFWQKQCTQYMSFCYHTLLEMNWILPKTKFVQIEVHIIAMETMWGGKLINDSYVPVFVLHAHCSYYVVLLFVQGSFFIIVCQLKYMYFEWTAHIQLLHTKWGTLESASLFYPAEFDLIPDTL